MPVTVYLAALAVAASVPVLWWAVAGARVPVARRVRSNLAAAGGLTSDLRRAVLDRPARARLVEPLLDGLARRARRLTPAGFADSLEHRIDLAGMAGRWTVDRVLAAKLGLASAVAVVTLLRFATGPSALVLALGLGCVALGWFAPDLLLISRAQERREEITRQLPDTLDQLTICVEAGLGFDAALARVATTGRGAIAEELSRTLQDVRLGVPRARAFDALVARTDVPELKGFVHAVGQADRFGIPIAHILRVQAAEARQRRRLRAEERAMKIPVKLVFPVVLCILPALFVVLIGPAAIRISHSSFGGR